MKYLVLKKFYDPVEGKRKLPGEMVEVADEHLEGYKPYIKIDGLPAEEIVIKETPTIEQALAAPPMKIIEKNKPKK